MFYCWILTAIVGLASSVLGFFMLSWGEMKGLAAGGPYVVFGILTFPFAYHLSSISGGWSAFLYVVGVLSMLFGIAVISPERRGKSWFVFRYFALGVIWLVLAAVIPEVTSSMRVFPVLVGAGYMAIALSTLNSDRLTGSYVGFDVALNGICFLFLGILLASVPDFFSNPGPSIQTP